MRCKNCDYRLWNLTSRRCPECGTPFLPSDFEFTPNSVRFCCPHCGQDYYGTGEKGHLAPIAFECVKCARHIHMDETMLLPTEGVAEESTVVDCVPWLERSRRGFFKAWIATIGMAMVRPGRLMRALPPGQSSAQAWWFAILSNALFALTFISPFFLLFMLVPIATGSGATAARSLKTLAAFMGGALLAATVGTLVVVALWGCVTHVVLRITGSTARGAKGSFQALCYAGGANILSATPCIGMYIGWIWWLISAVIMVKEAQQVRAWRAALSVLALPGLLTAAAVAFYVFLAVQTFSGAAPFGFGKLMLQGEAQIVLDGLNGYVADNRSGPNHAIELIVGDYLDASDVIEMRSDTLEEHVPVGSVTLERFAYLSESSRAEEAQAAIDALPDAVVAHRLGDFVFTYHGVDFSGPDPGLWLIVLSRDPNIISAATPARPIAVGLADGTVEVFEPDAFPTALAAQNALRAQYNLPPLPDPAQVTHVQPAGSGRP